MKQVVEYFFLSHTHRCLCVHRKCLASSGLLIGFHCFSSKYPPFELHHATPEHQVEQCCTGPIGSLCIVSAKCWSTFFVFHLPFVFPIGIVLYSLTNNLVEDVSEEWMRWRLAGVNLKSVCANVHPQVMLTRFNAAVLSDTLVDLSVGAKLTLPYVFERL